MLHKPSFVEEEEGTALVLSMLDCRCCETCWERDLERVCIWWFWEISNEFAFDDFEISPPHLFLYLFLFKRKTKVETKRTLPILNTGESKLYSNKKWEVLEAPDFFFENPGYLAAVLCLWSQARPCEFILQLPWWCSSQLHHHLLIYHRSNCKVSAQIHTSPAKILW